MQYNDNLFGAKQNVYNDANSTQLYCAVASRNSTLSAGLKTGAYQLNNNIDDSVFYWLVNSKSPYTRLSLINLTSSGGVNTVNKVDTDVKDKHLPLVLTWQNFKINADHDIDTTGTLANQPKNIIPNRRFVQSMFKTQGDVDTPLLYNTNGLSESTKNNNFNKAPFVVDFDYNNIIATIQVGTGASSNVQDLANYNNTASNYISTISLAFYIGEIDDNNTTRVNSYIQQRYINGVNCGGTQNNGMTIVSDYRYKTPDVLRNAPFYYNIDEFNFLQAITTSAYTTALFSGTLASSANIYNISYYMNDEHWELNDNNNGYRLKKHGNGVYNDDDFDYIRKCVAYLGFWFTDGGFYTDSEHSYNIYRHNTKLGINANEYADSYMIPDKVYQSEIKDGITTGNYIELRIAKDNDQSKWGKEWRNKNGYNGRDTGKEEKDFGNLNTVLHRGSIAAGCKWYGLNSTQLNSLITWMNSGYQPASNDQFVNDFKGVNPAEYITSITYLPFYPIPSGTDELINIGPLSTAVSGRKIAYEYGVTVDLGSYTLDRYFDDFRDFKPYTAISLYIPFCGTVELDAANYYNRTINVKLMIDMSTGSCTGLVFANDLLIDTISGQCGVKIPLAAFNMGDYQDAIINAQYQLKQAERQRDNAMIGAGIAIVGGAITASTGIGAVAGAAAAIYAVNKMYDARDRIENIEYNIEHMQPKQTNISTGSPTNSLGMEYDARLIITRPTTLDTDISIYGHTVGYMTNKQGTLSDFSGFTQCSNADLSGIPMTSSELASIHEALKSGVYLP